MIIPDLVRNSYLLCVEETLAINLEEAFFVRWPGMYQFVHGPSSHSKEVSRVPSLNGLKGSRLIVKTHTNQKTKINSLSSLYGNIKKERTLFRTRTLHL